MVELYAGYSLFLALLFLYFIDKALEEIGVKNVLTNVRRFLQKEFLGLNFFGKTGGKNG